MPHAIQVDDLLRRLRNGESVTIQPPAGREPFGRLWGIYDTQDDCWIGGDQGPTLYREWLLAQAGAQIVNARWNWPPVRCRARIYFLPYPRLRDTIEAQMTGAEAVRRLEEGGG
jgi:hypothetical protein